jgi:rod shape determining protein RodA
MLNFVKRIDLLLLTPAVLLSCLGLLLIFSTSYEVDPSFFVRQVIYILVSVFVFFIVNSLDFKSISHVSTFLYVAILLVLVATFIFGEEIRGSIRWIDLGFVTIQGSELAKPIIILTLANYFTKYHPSSIKNLIVGVILIALPLILILRQPDLSNSLILLSSWVFMVFLSGVNLLYLITIVAGLILTVPFIWNLLLKDYQKARVLTFFNPNLDPQGASYNVVQALIALGSGQHFWSIEF